MAVTKRIIKRTNMFDDYFSANYYDRYGGPAGGNNDYCQGDPLLLNSNGHSLWPFNAHNKIDWSLFPIPRNSFMHDDTDEHIACEDVPGWGCFLPPSTNGVDTFATLDRYFSSDGSEQITAESSTDLGMSTRNKYRPAWMVEAYRKYGVTHSVDDTNLLDSTGCAKCNTRIAIEGTNQTYDVHMQDHDRVMLTENNVLYNNPDKLLDNNLRFTSREFTSSGVPSDRPTESWFASSGGYGMWGVKVKDTVAAVTPRFGMFRRAFIPYFNSSKWDRLAGVLPYDDRSTDDIDKTNGHFTLQQGTLDLSTLFPSGTYILPCSKWDYRVTPWEPHSANGATAYLTECAVTADSNAKWVRFGNKWYVTFDYTVMVPDDILAFQHNFDGARWFTQNGLSAPLFGGGGTFANPDTIGTYVADLLNTQILNQSEWTEALSQKGIEDPITSHSTNIRLNTLLLDECNIAQIESYNAPIANTIVYKNTTAGPLAPTPARQDGQSLGAGSHGTTWGAETHSGYHGVWPDRYSDNIPGRWGGKFRCTLIYSTNHYKFDNNGPVTNIDACPDYKMAYPKAGDLDPRTCKFTWSDLWNRQVIPVWAIGRKPNPNDRQDSVNFAAQSSNFGMFYRTDVDYSSMYDYDANHYGIPTYDTFGCHRYIGKSGLPLYDLNRSTKNAFMAPTLKGLHITNEVRYYYHRISENVFKFHDWGIGTPTRFAKAIGNVVQMHTHFNAVTDYLSINSGNLNSSGWYTATVNLTPTGRAANAVYGPTCLQGIPDGVALRYIHAPWQVGYNGFYWDFSETTQNNHAAKLMVRPCMNGFRWNDGDKTVFNVYTGVNRCLVAPGMTMSNTPSVYSSNVPEDNRKYRDEHSLLRGGY